MNQQIADLLEIVQEEIGLYRDLIEHAKEKNRLLAQGRVEVILESNKVEETFAVKLCFLENEMKRLGCGICETLGIAHEEFTLIKLAECLEQSDALEIRSLFDRLRNVVLQLKSITARNRLLIDESLRYSQGLLGLISNATSSYQKTGLFRSVPSIQPTFSKRA